MSKFPQLQADIEALKTRIERLKNRTTSNNGKVEFVVSHDPVKGTITGEMVEDTDEQPLVVERDQKAGTIRKVS
jgi:hypothetical protein